MRSIPQGPVPVNSFGDRPCAVLGCIDLKIVLKKEIYSGVAERSQQSKVLLIPRYGDDCDIVVREPTFVWGLYPGAAIAGTRSRPVGGPCV